MPAPPPASAPRLNGDDRRTGLVEDAGQQARSGDSAPCKNMPLSLAGAVPGRSCTRPAAGPQGCPRARRDHSAGPDGSLGARRHRVASAGAEVIRSGDQGKGGKGGRRPSGSEGLQRPAVTDGLPDEACQLGRGRWSRLSMPPLSAGPARTEERRRGFGRLSAEPGKQCATYVHGAAARRTGGG
jgi:hypothetical protein